MSLTVTLKSENTGNVQPVMVDVINADGVPSKVADVFNMPQVKEIIGDESLEDVFIRWNDKEVGELAELILNQPVQDGDVYEIAVDFGADADDDDDDDDDDEGDEGATQQPAVAVGTPGTCTVWTNSHNVPITIQIRHLEMTLRDVIFNEAVIRRSGMTATTISNCDVSMNDEQITADRFDTTKVPVGASIALGLRVANKNG